MQINNDQSNAKKNNEDTMPILQDLKTHIEEIAKEELSTLSNTSETKDMAFTNPNLEDSFQQSRIYSIQFLGAQIYPLEIQVNFLRGLPGFSIVGLPDTGVKEARERVRCAIENSGLQFPLKNTIVNLSPARIKKGGTHLDLPIALAILLASQQIILTNHKSIFAAGELALDGRIGFFPGLFATMASVMKRHYDLVILPKDNDSDIPMATANAIMGEFLRQNYHQPSNETQEQKFILSQSLDQCLNEINNGGLHGLNSAQHKNVDRQSQLMHSSLAEEHYQADIKKMGCFSEVIAQEKAKRGLVIAAIGWHNSILIGPPGCGKSMLARRMPTIIPPLNHEQRIELLTLSHLHKQSHWLDYCSGKIPFRSPHHSSTAKTLTGGGLIPRAGEISLAHLGILFLDELTEFHINTLQALREPMETQNHIVHRNGVSYFFPADFLLLAAANPCKCGYLSDPKVPCSCSSNSLRAYLSKINGPLADRIDIEVELPRPETIQYGLEPSSKSSQFLMDQVATARSFGWHRQQRAGFQNFIFNSRLSPEMLNQASGIATNCHILIQSIIDAMGFSRHLSLRSYHKVLRIARSIADLDEREQVREEDIYEAISFKKALAKYLNYL